MPDTLIPFMPYRPDQGPLSSDSTDVALNVLAVSNGYRPFPAPNAPTSALPSQCLGSWYVRTTSGSYVFFAATQTKIYRLGGGGGWTDVSAVGTNTTVNGDFAVGTGWTLGTGVTISGGLGVFTAVTTGVGMTQAQTLAAGTSYMVTYTVSGYSTGGVQPVLSGGTTVSGTVRSANGTYTETLIAATGNTTFGMLAYSGGGVIGDPYFSYVVLLMGAEGTNGSTAFTDESSYHRTLTATGDTTISTAQFKFGTSSALFTGVAHRVEAADDDAWQLGATNSSPWTVECWVRFTSVGAGYSQIIGQFNTGARGWQVERNGANLEFFWAPAGTWFSFACSGVTFVNGVWYHIAVDHDAAGKIRAYVDGVMRGSQTPADSSIGNVSAPLSIGSTAGGGEPLAGWVDEVRITKGIARYASDGGFAVPTAAFPRIASSVTTLNIDNVVIQPMTVYTGPLPGDMWTAARYGSRFYVTNEMDPLQYIDVDSGSVFADAPGSPPRGKFVATIGDFLFLAYLRIGATAYPQDWQHSAIDDPADWVIDGGPGSSDRQSIASGDEITGIMARPNNGGRVFQRNAKRALIFSPGGAAAFEQRDIDSTNGVFAPYSIVDIGNDDYVYIHEQGVFRGDGHTPIGLDTISRTLIRRVDYDKIEQIQGSLETTSRRVLWRAQDQVGTWFVFGFDVERERFFMTDIAATSLTNLVGVATLIDDIHGLADAYTSVLVDSPMFSGGRVAPGVWLADRCMYALNGSPLEATLETPTFALNPNGGAFIHGLMLRGTALTFSAAIGSAARSQTAVAWSSGTVEAARTGVVPTRVDANFHRVRIVIPAGTDWTHVHAVTPLFKPSRRLAA